MSFVILGEEAVVPPTPGDSGSLVPADSADRGRLVLVTSHPLPGLTLGARLIAW